MFSIYNSSFNLIKMNFNYQEMLDNYCRFAEEVVISINTSDDDTYNALRIYANYKNYSNLKLVHSSFDYNDPFFDGKIKNNALKYCTQPFCILLDADERIRANQKNEWIKYAKLLGEDKDCDAIFIPVIDLFHSKRHYRNLAAKWYLHKNHINIERGVVDFAKLANNKIDITKSDTCEALINGRLVKTKYIVHPGLNNYTKLCLIKEQNLPIIYHLGWLDKQQRMKQLNFWGPVWQNRAKKENIDIIKNIEELDKIEYFEHFLFLWDE